VAIGRGQLQVLAERVCRKREIFKFYADTIGDLPGISLMPEAPWGRATHWLTVITVDPAQFGATREEIRLALEQKDIESRPLWKPMRLQPAFQGCEVTLPRPLPSAGSGQALRGRGAAWPRRCSGLGACHRHSRLPSGTAMTEADLARASA